MKNLFRSAAIGVLLLSATGFVLIGQAPALPGTSADRIGFPAGYKDTFKQLYRAVYEAIVSPGTGARLYPTFADGHREVLACEAILRSHREQRWVTV